MDNLIPFPFHRIDRHEIPPGTFDRAMCCAMCAASETCKLILPCDKLRALGHRAMGQSLALVIRFQQPDDDGGA